MNVRIDLPGTRRTAKATLHGAEAALLLLAAVSAAAPDFDAGMGAFPQGDYAAAPRDLKPLADRGDAYAQNLLGVMYADGSGGAGG